MQNFASSDNTSRTSSDEHLISFLAKRDLSFVEDQINHQSKIFDGNLENVKKKLVSSQKLIEEPVQNQKEPKCKKSIEQSLKVSSENYHEQIYFIYPAKIAGQESVSKEDSKKTLQKSKEKTHYSLSDEEKLNDDKKNHENSKNIQPVPVTRKYNRKFLEDKSSENTKKSTKRTKCEKPP